MSPKSGRKRRTGIYFHVQLSSHRLLISQQREILPCPLLTIKNLEDNAVWRFHRINAILVLTNRSARPCFPIHLRNALLSNSHNHCSACRLNRLNPRSLIYHYLSRNNSRIYHTRYSPSRFTCTGHRCSTS